MHGCPRGEPSALLHEPLRHTLAETILPAMLLAPDAPQGPRFGLGRCREASLAAVVPRALKIHGAGGEQGGCRL